jgi:dTDP-glucose 4,6-dehydratase
MARLLITGGAGFIGGNFTRYWLGAHPSDRVVVLDALTYAGDAGNLNDLRGYGALRFEQGDIRDRALVERLLREEDLDTLVNFAAESHVDRSIADPDAFITTNVVGTHILLRAARQVWLEEARVATPRFHQVSTDEVYGSLAADAAAWDESSPYAPTSPYAASKAAADHLVRAYGRTYGLPVTVSHCPNNYGPWQFPEKLIPLALTRLLAGRPVPLYGDGRHQREWLHVDDHCRGLDLLLRHGRAGETYHLGGGEHAANRDLVGALAQRVDRHFAQEAELRARFPLAPPARGGSCSSLVEFVADRPGHDRRYALDGTKAMRELGYEPRLRLEQGLAETLDWYLRHEAWWRPRT